MQRQPHELPSSLIEAARVYQQEAQPISSFLDSILDETKVTTYLAKVKPKGATDEELEEAYRMNTAKDMITWADNQKRAFFDRATMVYVTPKPETDDVCVNCGNPNCRTKNRPW
jgi:hypothetical protein